MKIFPKFIPNLLLVFFLWGCSLGVTTLNLKKERDDRPTQLNIHANEYFWENLHQGNYAALDSVFFYLKAAYSENSNHLETVTHLGFAHMWALSERQRLNPIPPGITDHATLALKYFGESYRMNPHDPRVLGFLADAKLTLGTLSEDSKLTTKGYFDGLKSIHQWKEFNYFTVGYVLSQLPKESWQFQKALNWQWKTIDACLCKKFKKDFKDLTPYLVLEATETKLQRKRACWNSWIAPHNMEGFFLNMGDMLVKNGDWKKGVEIYHLAKQVPQYESWPFQELLEHRITHAQSNVEQFQKNFNNREFLLKEQAPLIQTSISCVACHQMGPGDRERYRDFNWEHYKKINRVYGIHSK